MRLFDIFFFKFFLKKGELNNIKNKYLFLLFLKLFRIFLKGPFIVKIDNFKLNTYPNKNDPTYGVLKRFKFHEQSELNFIKDFIIKNKKILFIDGGANYGYYSLFVANYNFENQVIAFEPSLVNRERLVKNKELNSFNNIKIEKFAISNNNSHVNFYESQLSWENSIIKDYIFQPKMITVPTISLDIYFDEYDIKFESLFIKLDIEGSEINAFYGAKNLIKKHKPTILFEFSKMLITNKLFKVDELNDFLNSCNYSIFDLKKNKINLTDLCKKMTKTEKKYKTIGNFILLHKDFNY